MNDKISKTKNKICDMDCFNCPYPDCINDSIRKEQRYRDLTDEQKKRYIEHQKEKRHRNKAKGICVNCGVRPIYTEKNSCLCYECYIKRKRYREIEKERNRAKCLETRKYKDENNICIWCDKPRMQGRNICEEHYKTHLIGIQKCINHPNSIAERKRFNKQMTFEITEAKIKRGEIKNA